MVTKSNVQATTQNYFESYVAATGFEMDVSTSQKRKRPLLEDAAEQGASGLDFNTAKSCKITADAEATTPKEMDSLHANISSPLDGAENRERNALVTTGEMDVQQESQFSAAAPTSALKQILQQQWSAEAQKSLRVVYDDSGRNNDFADESIGSEIMSDIDTHHGELKISLPPRNGVTVSVDSKSINGTDSVPQKAAVAKSAPMTRSSIGNVNTTKSTLVTPIGDIDHVDGDNKVVAVTVAVSNSISSSSKARSHAIATSTGAADRIVTSLLTPILPTSRKDDGGPDINIPVIEDTTRLVKKRSKSKFGICWLLLLGILIIFMGFCFFTYVPTNNNTSMNKSTTVEDILSNGNVSEALLLPTLDDPIFTRGAQFLQQLSGLEQEVLLLSEILDHAAAVETESEILTMKSNAEQEEFKMETDNALIELESYIFKLEEEGKVLIENGVILEKESSELFSEGEVTDEELEMKMENLQEMQLDEENLETVIDRIEILVDESAANSEIDHFIDSDSDEHVTLAELDEVEVEVGDGLPRSAEDIERDTVIAGAVSAVEKVLSTLEKDLAVSVGEVDTAIKKHVSVQADEEYVRTAKLLADEAAVKLQAEIDSEVEREKEIEMKKEKKEKEEEEKKAKLLAVELKKAQLEKEQKEVDLMGNILNGRILDYAVWPRGGRVIPPGQIISMSGKAVVLTSLPYVLSQGVLKRFRHKFRLEKESSDASVLISHVAEMSGGVEKDEFKCYSFKGDKGNVTVTMHSAIRVSHIQILHSPKNSNQSNAPKKIKIIGWPEKPSSSMSVIEGQDIGTFEYKVNENKGEISYLQTFPISSSIPKGMELNEYVREFKAITVYVLSNHGDVTHTSICRIKILGELAAV